MLPVHLERFTDRLSYILNVLSGQFKIIPIVKLNKVSMSGVNLRDNSSSWIFKSVVRIPCGLQSLINTVPVLSAAKS